MRALIKIFSSIFAYLLLHSTYAATVLVNTNDGNIYGANNVVINSTSYNVVFIDGSCIAIFNGCNDSGDFIFNSVADAIDASNALFDQVLLDISANQQFDTLPHFTTGCTNSGLCRILTPFALTETENLIAGVSADNNAINANDVLEPNIGIFNDTDLATTSIAVYAQWSFATAVPAPAAWLLFSSCLCLLFAARSQHKK